VSAEYQAHPRWRTWLRVIERQHRKSRAVKAAQRGNCVGRNRQPGRRAEQDKHANHQGPAAHRPNYTM
jgi:hypothetical protein